MLGTPIQNQVAELLAVVDVIRNGCNAADFSLSDAIETTQQNANNKHKYQWFLRRLKSEYLPHIMQSKYFCNCCFET